MASLCIILRRLYWRFGLVHGTSLSLTVFKMAFLRSLRSQESTAKSAYKPKILGAHLHVDEVMYVE
jgi:hypothetical protein